MLIPEAGGEDQLTTANGKLKDEMIVQNALALEAQVEERPLAKKQEKLAEEEDKEAEAEEAKANVVEEDVEETSAMALKGSGDNPQNEGAGGGGVGGVGVTAATGPTSNGSTRADSSHADTAAKHHGHHHKKALLHNDDSELNRVGRVRCELDLRN